MKKLTANQLTLLGKLASGLNITKLPSIRASKPDHFSIWNNQDRREDVNRGTLNALLSKKLAFYSEVGWRESTISITEEGRRVWEEQSK